MRIPCMRAPRPGTAANFACVCRTTPARHVQPPTRSPHREDTDSLHCAAGGRMICDVLQNAAWRAQTTVASEHSRFVPGIANCTLEVTGLTSCEPCLERAVGPSRYRLGEPPSERSISSAHGARLRFVGRSSRQRYRRHARASGRATHVRAFRGVTNHEGSLEAECALMQCQRDRHAVFVPAQQQRRLRLIRIACRACTTTGVLSLPQPRIRAQNARSLIHAASSAAG
jgi:hypothetical protein